MEKNNLEKKLIFDVGINWTWYYVIIGDEYAEFRLHHGDKDSRDIYKEFKKENVFRSKRSSQGAYGFESVLEVDVPESSIKISPTPKFDFLKEFFTRYYKYPDVFHSLGVDFYKLESHIPHPPSEMDIIREAIKTLTKILEKFWVRLASKYRNNAMHRISFMKKILLSFSNTLETDEKDYSKKKDHLEKMSVISKIDVQKFSSFLKLPRNKKTHEEFSKLKEEAVTGYEKIWIVVDKFYNSIDPELKSYFDKRAEIEMNTQTLLFEKNPEKKTKGNDCEAKKKRKLEKI